MVMMMDDNKLTHKCQASGALHGDIGSFLRMAAIRSKAVQSSGTDAIIFPMGVSSFSSTWWWKGRCRKEDALRDDAASACGVSSGETCSMSLGGSVAPSGGAAVPRVAALPIINGGGRRIRGGATHN